MTKIDKAELFLAIDWLQWSDGRFDEKRAAIALKYLYKLQKENELYEKQIDVLFDALEEISYPSHPNLSNKDTVFHNNAAQKAMQKAEEMK